MPSIGDIIELADAIRVKPIEVDDIKCVAVRNRNSKCRRCADVCIVDAITIANNELSIDADACVNCGACVDVCPTRALRAINPAESETYAGIVRTSKNNSGHMTIACARKASQRIGDTEKYVSVPCLGHISTDLIMMCAASASEAAFQAVSQADNRSDEKADLVLVDGDCATCKYGAVSPSIDEVCSDTKKLLESAVSNFQIVRTSEFPVDVIDTNEAAKRGKSRRGLARQTGSYIKTIAGNVATKTLEEKLGTGGKKEPASLGERLKAGKNGKMPTFQPTKNYQLIENIEKLLDDRVQCAQSDEARDAVYETVDATYVDSRKFGSVCIDPEKCSGCGMCVLFCPTEALKYAEFDTPEDETRRYIEFQAADCIKCDLCKDVCLRNCLEVETGVPLWELLKFEPRLLEIARPQRQAFLSDIKKRFRR